MMKRFKMSFLTYQIESRQGFLIPMLLSAFLALFGLLWAIDFHLSCYPNSGRMEKSATVGLGLFLMGVTIFYTIEQISRPPTNSPFLCGNFLLSWQKGNNSTTKRAPLLVCLGDSLTHGACSANWVDVVQNTFCPAPLKMQTSIATTVTKEETHLFVVNAGQNNICSWTVWKERLEPVLNLNPDYIVLMIGTNDLRAIYNKLWSWHLIQMWGLPEVPSLDIFQHHLHCILTQILKKRPKVKQIGVCTLPPMGEDLIHHPANQIIRDTNKIIRKVVTELNGDRVTILPVFEKLEEEIGRFHHVESKKSTPISVDYFVPMAAWMDVAHCMLGISWNALGRCSGNVVLSDSLHLNERGGDIVAQIVTEWLIEKGKLSPIPKKYKVVKRD